MTDWGKVLGAAAMGLAIAGMAAAETPTDITGVNRASGPPHIARAVAGEYRDSPRWVVRVDNDLFAGHGADRDYTGGLTLTAVDQGDRPVTAANRAIQRWLDARVGTGPASDCLDRMPGWAMMRAGLQAFTPQDTETDLRELDDRPYASLVYLGTSRYALDEARRTLYESTLTLGALGLDAAELLQAGVHRLVGSAEPLGYRHQVADGGEPTFRYELARHYLVASAATGRGLLRDLRFTTAGSVGYLTEVSTGLEWRFGRIATPWWAAAAHGGPEGRRNSGAGARSTRPELYVIAGTSVHARAYSALLQGQFRDGDVTLRSSMLRHIVGQAWLGGVVTLRNVHIGYTVRYQSSEIRRGAGARSSSWAEIAVTRGSR